ncbi:MAG: glycine cleavage system protein GcvH [candidate division WOR-3 bacterium]
MSNIPNDLKYTKTHEWIKVEDSTALIGITDFAQRELSDIVYIEITALNKEVRQDDPIGVIEAVKAVADIYAPVSGTVIAANDALRDEPAKVNQSPYEDGWLAKIRISNPEELNGLLDPAAYAELVKRSTHH